ncbi:N-acetylneuraminate synthase family protein [Minwuia thermotolerans]|nr:N-acetylneuraminate synthase family protein [Minwuia thermotolerans]
MLGGGNPPLLLPDIDMFFNADIAMAQHMVKAVRDAGLTIIKAAVLHDEAIALNCGTMETFLDNRGRPVTVDYRRLISKKVISKDEHRRLFRFIQDTGLELVLSVYDLEGLNLAVDSGAVAIKIPSSNITHQPLIAAAALAPVPLIVDTGKSTMVEIARALEWAAPARERGLIVEHSPEAPPAPLARHQLMMIPRLAETFDLNAGLSDHHHGNEMMLAATALGAVVLEKGLTVDDPDSDQDVYHAMRLSDLKPLRRQVEMIYDALGDGRRTRPSDRPVPHSRMGAVAARGLSTGEMLSLSNVGFALPPLGVGAEHWPIIEGWQARREVAAGEPVGWEDIEPPS